MRWEIWDAVSGNIIADFQKEPEALGYVRALLAHGWKPEDLLLMFDDPALADDDLPPAITGHPLVQRALAAEKPTGSPA